MPAASASARRRRPRPAARARAPGALAGGAVGARGRAGPKLKARAASSPGGANPGGHPAPRTAHPRPLQAVVQDVDPRTAEAAAPAAAAPEPARPETLAALWPALAAKYGSATAVHDAQRTPKSTYSYAELADAIDVGRKAVQELGLLPGEKAAVFSENGSRWLILDQAVMAAGAANAVRGSTSPDKEMKYIIEHSESSALVVQDWKTLERVAACLEGRSAELPAIRFAVVLWGDRADAPAGLPAGLPVYTFDEAMAVGAAAAGRPVAVAPDDLATIVYTSGTTGSPKGVMLNHSNLMYQVNNLDELVCPDLGDASLSLLPPWHIYERTCGYFALSCGIKQVYTSVAKFRQDLQRMPPEIFVTVPLVLDTLYSKVMQTLAKDPSALKKALAFGFLALSQKFIEARRVKEGVSLDYATAAPGLLAAVRASVVYMLLWPVHQLATKLVYGKIKAAIGIKKTIISGGGAIGSHLDDFFEIIGICVVNGWGLTETSPVLAGRPQELPAARLIDSPNVRGTVGYPLSGTSLKVVDPETMEEVPDGQSGLILAKGPGVLQGYYKNDSATAKAFRGGKGWFDTGDLGYRVPADTGSNAAGCIALVGREKDTIVLYNGENIEPQAIEDECCRSPWIKHLMLVGQDQRHLGALVALDAEYVEAEEEARGAKYTEAELQEMVEADVASLVKNRSGYRPDERIAKLAIIPALSPDDGTLTRTMKVRRNEVLAKYGDIVDALYA